MKNLLRNFEETAMQIYDEYNTISSSKITIDKRIELISIDWFPYKPFSKC